MVKQNGQLTKEYLNWLFETKLDLVLEEKLDNKLKPLHDKFDQLFKKLDWFAGKYTKFDQEGSLQAEKISALDERVEKLEQNARVVVQ
jgi:hypothetical protein